MAVRYTRELLEEAARVTRHIDDAVRHCGGSPTPGSTRYLRRKLAEAGIDASHLATGQVRHTESRLRAAVAASSSIKEVGPLRLRTPEEGRAPGARLRRALVAAGVPQRCRMCGTGPEWNGRPLTLEVDHISGEWWDDRARNLRLLCPNCHAVTETYRGRKKAS